MFRAVCCGCINQKVDYCSGKSDLPAGPGSPVIAHKQERQQQHHCKHAEVQVHGWGAMKLCEMVDGEGTGRTQCQEAKWQKFISFAWRISKIIKCGR